MGTVTPLPAPPEAPVCMVCGCPARMALTVTAAGGRGYVHEQVWFDWRAAPTQFQSPRFYCKAHGVRTLVTLTDLYVAEDSLEDLDPQGEPADPNAAALAKLTGGGQ